MGKKKGSSWISTIKKVFTSKHNPQSSASALLDEETEADKKSLKKENKGKGVRSRFKRALFREPSSIEKILGDIDQHHLFIPHLLQSQPPPQVSASSSSSSSQRPASPPRLSSPPRINSPPNTQITPKPEPTLLQHRSATRIQAAYRAYLARKKVKGLTGLVRLQGVVRGQNVKRQTVNAMKQMQLLVRVQTQIQSQRIQMLQNQRQPNNNHKQLEASLGTNLSEMGDGYWDDSLITKEERGVRLQKKAEAVINRERAMAYAYSHQLGKGTPTSAKTSLIDIRTGGYPWWWNWLERQLPQPIKTSTTPDHKRSNKQHDHLETPATPMSSRSMVPPRSRTPPNRMMRYSKAMGGGGGGSPYPVRDNDSLMSCPAFSVPNYMSPTVSAKAKARPTSNPKDRVTPSTPGSESSRRRFSFPFTPNNNKWNKHKSPGSIGDLSMDSAISMPASVGRKPFNRFV